MTAQHLDVGVHGAVLTEVVVVPYLLQDLFAAEGDALVGGQEHQQVELLGGQGHILPGHPHGVAGGVDGQVPEGHGGGRSFRPVFIVFIIYVQVKMKQGTKTPQWNQSFWSKEKASNFARKKDISELDYLEVDQNLLPWDDQADGAIQDAQDDVREILKRPILNLQGMSNADIKLNYGIANFEILSACDQNYARLIRALNQWGEALYQSEKLADAESIFSYALDIGSDISSTYITLGKIYAQTDRIEQIQPLIERVKKQDFFMRDTVIDKLTGIVRSYQ